MSILKLQAMTHSDRCHKMHSCMRIRPKKYGICYSDTVSNTYIFPVMLAEVKAFRFIPAHAGNTSLSHRSAVGSSPRMRGTRAQFNATQFQSRFIPAHAGNTTTIASAASTATGSSPRMRGTPLVPVRTSLPIRFIPAHAGNTSRLYGARTMFPVHPRACGEHSPR